MQSSKLIAAALAATMLTACTEPNGEPGRGVLHGGALNKEEAGTAIGAIGGGVIGSTIGGGAGQVAATIGGALLGGILGNQIGQSMDRADMASYDRASQSAMQTGRTQRWRNEHTGNYGTIHPYRHYRNSTGEYCREYSQTIVIDGRAHEGHGTACREEDGTWRIVE